MQQIEILEEKIKKMIDVIKDYREENSKLSLQVEEFQGKISDYEKKLSDSNGFEKKYSDLLKEKELLQDEKDMVKSSVEKLLQDIENIV